MQHPEQLGKYRVTGVIGEGAMGIVYKGFDPDIQRVVALKTIRRHPGHGTESGAKTAARFRNEAQAAGRLLHPGIVAVYEYGEDGAVAFIAMEYVEGNSLARYLSQGVRFAEDDILSLIVQLLDALDHAHAQGVWHRDIKPANLMVTRLGKLKVADFGIARIDSLELTQTNMVIGTPSHMAPEQYIGGALDRRVDVYASGALLYELLAGRPPFTGTPESLMYKVLNEVPVPPSQVENANRPAFYDPIVMKALAKRPEERYASAAEFRDALLAAVGEPVSAALSDKTLIMQPLQRAGPLGSPSGGFGGTPTPGASGSRAPSPWTTAPPADWDPAVLAQIEADLARHVGPIARVLVRRTARECNDPATLRMKLAVHVNDQKARTTFIGKAGATASARSAPRAVAGSNIAPMAPVALSDSMVEQAQRLLAQHIGPIAKVVVKKAQAQAQNRDQFMTLLTDAVPASPARDKLLFDLSRLE